MAKRILIIDDEEQFAQMLQDLLQMNGYEAEFCLNPKEALNRVQQENYELVITDYKMPEMDGASFLEATRKVTPDLPVIMISGLMNMPELIRVANIGVTLVLEKPFKTEELLENVGRFVEKKDGEEQASSSYAMDMEASEIDFQPENVTYTYPAPARFIADLSNENKRFLETLWNSASAYRHIPCFASRGAEVRLIAREMGSWLDQPDDSELVRIDLLDTKNEITQEWFLGQDPVPGILLVDGRGAEWNEERVKLLANWITFVESADSDLSMTRFIYILPMGAPINLEMLPMKESLKSLVSMDCPVLLTLRDRVDDVAGYIKAYFSSDELSVIGQDVLKQLLHYSWPGGHDELQKVLTSVKRAFESGKIVDVTGLREIIGEGHADLESLKGELGLDGYLKRRQREYLMLHREGDEEMKNTLLRMGIEAKDIDPEAILKDEVLVYPELANDNSDEG